MMMIFDQFFLMQTVQPHIDNYSLYRVGQAARARCMTLRNFMEVQNQQQPLILPPQQIRVNYC